MAGIVNLIGFGLAMIANAWLLFVVAPSEAPKLVLKRASLAVTALYLGTPVLILGLWAIGFQPPPWFGTRFFQLIMTGVVLAMISFANLIFHGMVDGIAAFHQKHNAANLHRFPISVLIGHKPLLKRGATAIWFLGSGLMFYGIWTDTHI